MAKKHHGHEGHEQEHDGHEPEHHERPLGEVFAHAAARESAQVARLLKRRPRAQRFNAAKHGGR